MPSEPYLLEQVNARLFVAVLEPDDDSVSIVLESTPCLLSKASVLGGRIGGDVTVGPGAGDASEMGTDSEIDAELRPPHVRMVEVL